MAMIESLGNRLRIVLRRGPTETPEPEPELEPATPLAPEIEFIAYAEDCLLSGHLRMRAERLTEMLN